MISFLAAIHVLLWLTLVSNAVYLWRGRRQRAEPARWPSVSILIPARNEETNLRRLLPSLSRQDYPDFEVVVYDDGSDDGTWAVLEGSGDARIRGVRGEGPPPGWIGKVHALFQASRHARGARYLFLDADAELTDDGALRRLVAMHEALPSRQVLTGMTRLRGGGGLLVSLVPNALLAALPWALSAVLPFRSLGALNGQCWLTDAALYHEYEPHQHLPTEVLEDVQIGRYLKAEGVLPVLRDVQGEVEVHMYRSLADAWQGFRKNAYLIIGGSVLSFVLLFPLYTLTYVLAPFFSPWFLLSLYGLKATTDRISRIRPALSLLAPVSYTLGVVMNADSAFHHWTGRVAWKGRRV